MYDQAWGKNPVRSSPNRRSWHPPRPLGYEGTSLPPRRLQLMVQWFGAASPAGSLAGSKCTGGAAIVSKTPGLQYLAPLVWLIVSDKPSIVKALRERGCKSEPRSGGMVGMLADGLLGAFRTQPGVDSLLIGRELGLIFRAPLRSQTASPGLLPGAAR